jgi:nicotinamidase-related amidase
MARKIDLVLIDPQNSFCKVVPASEQQLRHDGELCVSGAWDDMERVAGVIDRLRGKLNDIHVTLDSHHHLHVAHPCWYKDSSGNQPLPFTIMREENGSIVGSRFDSNGNQHDVGEYTCFKPSVHKRTLDYLRTLSANNRYPHCIWPPHCLIGTQGHNVVPHVYEALLNWEKENFAAVDFVTKGSNFFVEHFSAVKAEVVDPEDPSTQLNTDFINTLMEADEVIFAGEAGSHCLANTVRDIADSFKDDSFIKKCVLLTDGTSPVPGFESYQQKFISDMTARGMKTSTCADYLS